jgi:UDP-2-acetamido-3-amino-2,3-dideoxy-glucuronate N-acetyltransferase
MGGVSIGEYSLIAAGSLVTKDVPAFSLMLGNPARLVGRVDEKGIVIERF